jgi:hypothetical protein
MASPTSLFRRLTIFSVCLISILPAFAQNGEEVTLKVELRDGTVVIGQPKTKSFPVSTDYGDVTISIDKLLSVRPGLRVKPETQAEIGEALKNLNPEDFLKRDEALEKLKNFGADAVPTLRAFLDKEGIDEDIEAMINQVLKDLDPKRKVVGYDSVEAEGMTCEGALQIRSLEMASSLGELSINMDLISEIRFQRQMTNLGEDFESLEIKGSDWSVTSSNNTVWQAVEREGSRALWAGQAGGANYSDGASATLVSPEYDLSSMASPTFSARTWIEVEEGCDSLTVEFSGDGSNWTNVANFGKSTRQWQPFTKDLSEYKDGGAFQFRLVFTSDGSGNYRGCLFDDLEISDSD